MSDIATLTRRPDPHARDSESIWTTPINKRGKVFDAMVDALKAAGDIQTELVDALKADEPEEWLEMAAKDCRKLAAAIETMRVRLKA
jgi:hypothetical protein